MKLVSWNVNGIRAAMKSGFFDAVAKMDPDVLCLQETKAAQEQITVVLPGYLQFWNSADRRGYSGTAIFSKIKPLSFSCGMGMPEHDREGRIVTLEFDRFYLVDVYTPNAQHGLVRLDYRMKWDENFLSYLKRLEAAKPVIFCGDLNVAHKEIDLKNPKSNVRNPGFTPEERRSLDRYVENGFIDTFREFNKEPGNYTWWSYRFNARQKDIGWRIDYFWISKSLRGSLLDAFIVKEVNGSDHCPVGIVIEE